MMQILKFTAASVTVAFALLSLACGGGLRQMAQQQQRANDLKQIGITYILYCDAHKNKGPADADELIKFDATTVGPLQKAKNGEYVMIWGADVTDTDQFKITGKSETILGYEASAPTSGGFVLFCDGSVRQITAVEFKSKTLAQHGGGKK
jgi:hypothetical protein